MKIYRDLEYVKKRKRMATLSAVAGVALLGSAFWAATAAGPAAVLVAYLPLLAGTIIFHLGMQQVGKWNRAQRNDVILDALLKDLGDRYTLVHYAKLGKRVVEHALIYPGGVLAITTKEVPGEVSYRPSEVSGRDGRWRKVGQGLSRFFGMGGPQVGNPTGEAATDVQALESTLAAEHLEADVDAVVAFVNPQVRLDVIEPDFPVTNAEGLRPYIASLPADPTLQSAERQRLLELLLREGSFELPQATPTRRPVKRRAA